MFTGLLVACGGGEEERELYVSMATPAKEHYESQGSYSVALGHVRLRSEGVVVCREATFHRSLSTVTPARSEFRVVHKGNVSTATLVQGYEYRVIFHKPIAVRDDDDQTLEPEVDVIEGGRNEQVLYGLVSLQCDAPVRDVVNILGIVTVRWKGCVTLGGLWTTLVFQKNSV
jgi:hypothetical protein